MNDDTKRAFKRLRKPVPAPGGAHKSRKRKLEEEAAKVCYHCDGTQQVCLDEKPPYLNFVPCDVCRVKD